MHELVLTTADIVNVDSIPFDEPIGWVVLAMVGLAVVVGPWVLLLGTRQLRQGYRLFASDPVGAGEVETADGVVEVEGTARELDGVLSGQYSDEPAFAQSWRRERKEERTNSDGEERTSWDTVSEGSDSVPFVVEDATGEVVVDPAGATLSIEESRQRSRSGIWLFDRSREYREYEGRIGPGDDVYVYGQKRPASDDDAPVDDSHYVGSGSDVSEFVVSDVSELRTVLRYVGTGAFLVFVAALWIPISTFAFLALLEAAFGVPLASRLVELLP